MIFTGKQWPAIYSTSEVKHKYANMQISTMLMLRFNICDYNKQRALLRTPSLIEMLQATNNSFLKIDLLLLHPIKNGWGGGGGGVIGSCCCFSFSWKLKIIRIVAEQCKKSESHVASFFSFLISYSSSEVLSLLCCLCQPPSMLIHWGTVWFSVAEEKHTVK